MTKAFWGAPRRIVFKAMTVVGLCLTVSACTTMSNITAPLTSGGGLFGSSNEEKKADGWTPTVTQANMLSAAQGEGDVTGSTDGGCPPFDVITGERTVSIRAPKASGEDMMTVSHRGEITKTARECRPMANGVSMKLGFAGRVLLGPEGKPGNVMLPVKITVVDASKKTVKTEALKVPVTVAPGETVGYFSMVREITVLFPGGASTGGYKVYIAFDRSVPGAS
jgi:hypothetical protein